MPGGKRLGRLFGLGHVQTELHLTQGRVLWVVGQRDLRVEGQHQHGRVTVLRAWQHHAPRQHPRDEAVARRGLLHIAQRPCHRTGPQQESQLRIQRLGKGVQFPRARHHLQHVGEVGHGANTLGKGLDLLDELRVLDLVEGTRPVGQLHPSLELRIGLPMHWLFPGLRGGIQAFHIQRLAARTPAGRQMRHGQIPRDGGLQREDDDGVDQGVQPCSGPQGRQAVRAGQHRVRMRCRGLIQAGIRPLLFTLGTVRRRAIHERGLLSTVGAGRRVCLARGGTLPGT